MTGETLHLFRDEADVLQFFRVVVMAYAGALAAIEAGGVTLLEAADNPLDNQGQAVLLGRAVVRMLQHKADRAAEIVQSGKQVAAEADAELAKLWSMFEEFLEQELADARKMVEKLRAEGRGSLH